MDPTLTVENYINKICNKANQKLNALSKIPWKEESNYEIFYYIKSWLIPLVRMLHSQGLNNKINTLHKKALRTAYPDKISLF